MLKSLQDLLRTYTQGYARYTPKKSDFEHFIRHLVAYKHDVQHAINTNQKEENVKSKFCTFLAACFDYEIPIQLDYQNIDVSICNQKNEIKAICEFKALNASDMLTDKDYNKKSLQQAIYYFYKLRKGTQKHVKHVIITDGQQFYFIDPTCLLDRQLENVCNAQMTEKGTTPIYREIGEVLKNTTLLETIKQHTVHFDMRAYMDWAETHVDNMASIDYNAETTRCVVDVYKVFHSDFLLWEYSPKDSNQLNKKFYNELLYILGLKEHSKSGKTTIVPSYQDGALMTDILYKIETQTRIAAANRLETGFSLITIWLNRILFLKLFEGQLLTFNRNDRHKKDYRFMSSNKVVDFDDLNALFFEILGVALNKRHPKHKNKSHIPYLNSSLFELSDIEQQAIRIANIDKDLKLPVIYNSVLPQQGNNENTLKYLLNFLDAYDFASAQGDDVVREDTVEIINPAVLGLIFEKLNGYKDGAFYTPGYITEYMAEQSINRAVVQKFNDTYNWDCKNMQDVKNRTGTDVYKKYVEYNVVIDSVTICDPAVGSGHFLVSALNYIIALKSALDILYYGDKKIHHNIQVIHDTLCITDRYGTPFVYDRFDITKHNYTIQKSIFHAKKQVIENQLFGVDINPNSVAICQLRLWIELLKHTYYHDDGTMEILPNIDINVKYGDSLISKFLPKVGHSIFDSTDGQSQLGKKIKAYKQAVRDYKHSNSKSAKEKVNDRLSAIKNDLYSVVQLHLFEKNDGDNLFKNSMEWMLEFPEVLDDKGMFKGFDVVIGNPPYIPYKQVSKISAYKEYEVVKNGQTNKPNVYCLFIERSLQLFKPNGILQFITPISFLVQSDSIVLRQLLLNKNIFELLDTSYIDVFHGAGTYTVILGIANNTLSDLIKTNKIYDLKQLGQADENRFIDKKHFSPPEYLIILSPHLNLLKSLENTGQKLGDCATVQVGISAAGFSNHIIPSKQAGYEKCLIASNIFKYSIDSKHGFIKADVFSDRKKAQFAKQKIVTTKMTNTLRCYIDRQGFFLGKVNFIIPHAHMDIEILTAFLNSKVFDFYYSQTYDALHNQGGAFGYDTPSLEKFPIQVKIHTGDKQKLIQLVHKCQDTKRRNPNADITKYELQIDNIIYKLYDLKKTEINIIENRG